MVLIFRKLIRIIEWSIKWSDDNLFAEAEDFKEKLEELERICNPMIAKMYGAGGAPYIAGGMNDDGPSVGASGVGPEIEELD